MSDLNDRDRLVEASRRARGEKPLVTPCCKSTPELREFRLWCPCGLNYPTLSELETGVARG